MDIKSVFWNFFHLGVYMMATKMWTVIKNTDLACSWIFDFYLKMTRSKKIYRIYKPNFNTPLPRAFFGVTRTTLFFSCFTGSTRINLYVEICLRWKINENPSKIMKIFLRGFFSQIPHGVPERRKNWCLKRLQEMSFPSKFWNFFFTVKGRKLSSMCGFLSKKMYHEFTENVPLVHSKARRG